MPSTETAVTIPAGASTQAKILEYKMHSGDGKFLLEVRNLVGNPLTELRLEGSSIAVDAIDGLDARIWIPIIGSTPIDDWAGIAASNSDTITRAGVITVSTGVKSATPVGSLLIGEVAIIELNLNAYDGIRLIANSTLGTNVSVKLSYKG